MICRGSAWQRITPTSANDGSAASRPAVSCKQILADGYAKGNGLYHLSDGAGGSFQAYCDMAGGWTLIAVGNVGNFANNSAFWTGTLGSNIAFTWAGQAMSTAQLEKAIRVVPCGELRTEYWTAAFADRDTPFATKVSLRAPTIVDRTTQFGFSWDRYFDGDHTNQWALLGTDAVSGYGDRLAHGLATRAETSSGGAGCLSNCATWHTVGYATHRGAGPSSLGAWVR
jgi:hypothetical protein